MVRRVRFERISLPRQIDCRGSGRKVSSIAERVNWLSWTDRVDAALLNFKPRRITVTAVWASGTFDRRKDRNAATIQIAPRLAERDAAPEVRRFAAR